MNILPLCGKSNSGKNSAIKFAVKFLLEHDSTSIIYTSCFRRADESQKYDKQRLISFVDESIETGLDADINISLIILKYNDKIIGFTTYGDSFSDIEKVFLRAISLTQNKMDIFVCARHEKNNILDEFKALTNNPKVLESVISDRSRFNDRLIWEDENKLKGEKLANRIINYME